MRLDSGGGLKRFGGPSEDIGGGGPWVTGAPFICP